jgi:nitroreductase
MYKQLKELINMPGNTHLHALDEPLTGEPVSGDPMDNDTTEVLAALLKGRHSCRAYRPEQLPRPIIERILDVAARTPSWCNVQPWHLTITEGAGTEQFRAALAEEASIGSAAPDFPFPERYEGVYQERRRECGIQLYESVGVVRGDRVASAREAAKNFELFGAPHVAIVTTEAALGVYGAVDCGLYVQSFLLAAQSLGVGAIPQAALAVHSQFVREYFGLPDTRQVVCGISFGWPDATAPVNGFRTSRLSGPETATFVTR